MKRHRHLNHIALAMLTRLLLDGDMTCAELAEETGLHYVTVLRYCRELQLAGAAYVRYWEANTQGKFVVRVLALGIEKDAPRTVLSSSIRSKAYRAKRRQMDILRRLAA